MITAGYPCGVQEDEETEAQSREVSDSLNSLLNNQVHVYREFYVLE
jgi:hypothetical protein